MQTVTAVFYNTIFFKFIKQKNHFVFRFSFLFYINKLERAIGYLQ